MYFSGVQLSKSPRRTTISKVIWPFVFNHIYMLYIYIYIYIYIYMSDRMAKPYVCTLDEASLKKAREELNEIPSDRMAAVQALRDWITQQPHFRTPEFGKQCLVHPTVLFVEYCRGVWVDCWVCTIFITSSISTDSRRVEYSVKKCFFFFKTSWRLYKGNNLSSCVV